MTEQKPSQKPNIPSDMDLANYARAYVGAYMSAVQSEGSEHPPMFARNHPYSIEVCFLPNGCFAMLFEKAEKASIAVSSQDWDYVMGKVMSGICYLVTVYPHEGFGTDGAIAKGKRDAIRDIRALDSSDLADSTRQLEKLLDDLRDVTQWNKSPVKMAEQAIAKLEPIKQSIARAGPTIDMMSMIDAVKSYPPPPKQVTLDEEGLRLIEAVVKELGSLQDLVKKIEDQDTRIAELEKCLKTDLEDFKAALDKKMAKGLGVILATTDRKIDKAIGAAAAAAVPDEPEEDEEDDPRFDVLADEIAALKETLAQLQTSSAEPPSPVDFKVPEELVASQEHLNSELRMVGSRVKRIEAYLTALSSSRNVVH